MGLTYKNLIKPAAERNEDDRAAWRHTTRLHYTAAQMVFVDESSIDRRDLRRDRGRGLRGLRAAQKFRQARGQRFSLLPALSLNGYLVVRVVPGSVDGFEFYDFLVNDLLPIMNPYPQPCSVLVLDNCNIHKSAAVREAVDAAGA
ncbi:hypothetical protein FA95DRAFT_1487343 [Auriscalpium vulgare]|uniref:Uncharacterized protein n=1 Tax=Auriscalpium vulgare TaxID=40419 RepID=A0ACB8S2M0_9AGAM|nr:hypothetical protein FA95DRAFT_1487343 [Auriscalpium vulgare]